MGGETKEAKSVGGETKAVQNVRPKEKSPKKTTMGAKWRAKCAKSKEILRSCDNEENRGRGKRDSSFPVSYSASNGCVGNRDRLERQRKTEGNCTCNRTQGAQASFGPA